MKMPEKVPEPGFYYHYKHDPARGVTDYAYEVMGAGWHTEAPDIENSTTVLYRPLYDSSPAYHAGKLFWLRPLAMFTEDVTKDGKTFPRFKKITDPNVIAELERVRDQMYP